MVRDYSNSTCCEGPRGSEVVMPSEHNRYWVRILLLPLHKEINNTNKRSGKCLVPQNVKYKKLSFVFSQKNYHEIAKCLGSLR